MARNEIEVYAAFTLEEVVGAHVVHVTDKGEIIARHSKWCVRTNSVAPRPLRIH